MKKRNIIITVIIIILLLLYFFHPLCGFKRIGSKFRADDNCNSCKCTITGGYCTLLGCASPEEARELSKEFEEYKNR